MGVPDGTGNGYPIDRAADPATWWEAVYSDTALITQFDDGAGDLTAGAGRPTSSNSAPGAAVTFLEHLWVRDHDRVLEIGTGTGWTAALLCHRPGEQNVTSIEVDAGLRTGAEKKFMRPGTNLTSSWATGRTATRAARRTTASTPPAR